MTQTVVKRFPDDKLFGAGAAAMARWANDNNARVVGQTVSNGWRVVTFEIMEEEIVDTFEDGRTYKTANASVTTRLASSDELAEMAEQDKRLESQKTRMTVIHLRDAEEDTAKKKRWWRR